MLFDILKEHLSSPIDAARNEVREMLESAPITHDEEEELFALYESVNNPDRAMFAAGARAVAAIQGVLLADDYIDEMYSQFNIQKETLRG